MLRRRTQALPNFRRRHITIGLNETDDSWAFVIDGRDPMELGAGNDLEEYGENILAVRLLNTLCLSERQLDKGMVLDVGTRPRRGVKAPRPQWREVASGLVSSNSEALSLLGEALRLVGNSEMLPRQGDEQP